MKMKERTLKELEGKIRELEDVIARKGVGSTYLQKAERVQRDLNIALMLGLATTLIGMATWMIIKSEKDR